MPKGKPKKNNPGLYGESALPQQPNKAPQAAPHRRGGVHRVRDKDLTNSIYDDYSYTDLLAEAKDRHLYKKDMVKVQLAIALRDDDIKKKREERYAIIEGQKMEQKEKEERQKKFDEQRRQATAKHKWRIEKARRRKRDESVSDDTLSDSAVEAEHKRMYGVDEYTREKIGQALSDESWDSTSSESTSRSVNQFIAPDCKLRLFEWPYPHMPSSDPPPLPSISGLQLDAVLPDDLPWKVPYVPLKVITTGTRQKLFLPGQKYPPGVDPDFVPVLSLQTRNAARNGVLEGVLRKATIERATHWAQRTHIQGWNARMFFSLPARNETKDLAKTYKMGYLENRKLLRVKGRGDGVPTDRARRHAQRHRNKAKLTAEVYEASRYRPLAMCYIPAYLDFSFGLRKADAKHAETQCSLENLFFIRFPACDVPHYYFWSREGEWADPTMPKPAWDHTMVQQEQASMAIQSGAPECKDDQQGARQAAQSNPRQSWKAPSKYWVRVKRPDAIPSDPISPSSPSDFATILSQIESELYTSGLTATLSKYRAKWVANGKQHAWKVFAHALPILYPSGQMPDAPPVETHAGAKLAIKLATIDSLEASEQKLFSPLRGDEAWTRDDDRFWDVVEVDVDEEDRMLVDDVEEDGLFRRSSVVFRKSREEWDTWLDHVNPSQVLPATISLPRSPTDDGPSSGETKEWEQRFLRPAEHETSTACPFCSMEWKILTTQAKAEHMLSHSASEDAYRRRPSAEQHPPFTPPPKARRRSRRLVTTNINFFDAGADGDVDTPIASKAPKSALRIKTKAPKKRRPSAETYTSASPSSHIPSPPLRLVRRWPADHDNAAWDPRRHSTSGSEHVTSPYLPCVKRYPPDHPDAAWNPRRYSVSSVDSLEFLLSYAERKAKTLKRKSRKQDLGKDTRKKRRTGDLEPQVEVGILPSRLPEPAEDGDVSLHRLYFLRRRGSSIVDPTYRDLPSPPRSSTAEKSRKRKGFADPTYRDTPLSPTLSDKILPPLRYRKRKRVADPTYRETPLLPASSMEAPPALKMRRKLVDSMSRDRLVPLPASSIDIKRMVKRRRRSRKMRRQAERGDPRMFPESDRETGIGGVAPALRGRGRKRGFDGGDEGVERGSKRLKRGALQSYGESIWCAVM